MLLHFQKLIVLKAKYYLLNIIQVTKFDNQQNGIEYLFYYAIYEKNVANIKLTTLQNEKGRLN